MARSVSTGFAALAAALALPIVALAGAAGAQSYGQGYGQVYVQSYAAPTTYGQARYESSSRYEHARYRGYGRHTGEATGYSYGYVGVGTPLSEVETRAYVNTGRYADGYSYGRAEYDGYGYAYGGYSPSHSYGHDDRGGRYGYSHGGRRDERRHVQRRYVDSREGYRDWYGYNDDRPPAHHDTRYRGDRCGCAQDVYYYDR